MTDPMTLPRSEKNIAVEMAMGDLQDIRHIALANIAGEILQISDFVEDNIGDLSDEFMKLVEYSRLQVDDMTIACDLLQQEKPDRDGSIKEKVHEMLRESAEGAGHFHKNVNRMIYSLQFQDRVRQLMHAMSVTLNILINLSESLEKNQNSEDTDDKATISKDNKNILTRLIENEANRELDQTYILKMFMGSACEKGEAGCDHEQDFTDIEFF